MLKLWRICSLRAGGGLFAHSFLRMLRRGSIGRFIKSTFLAPKPLISHLNVGAQLF